MNCGVCGQGLHVPTRGRKPSFCSTRCRVAAHRANRIPAEMLAAPRWLRHDRKRPITVDGRPASSTDPRTWSDYRTAKASTAGNGLGFALGDGFACLDLDHCLVFGIPDSLARSILDATTDAYAEVSLSGDGLHIFGTAPEMRGRKSHGIEAYSAGRFIAVTGTTHRAGQLVDLSPFWE